MEHATLAFFSTVVRFLALHFAPKREWSLQYQQMRRWLTESNDFEADDSRPLWQRRGFRRVATPELEGILSAGGLVIPCEIKNLSASGVAATIFNAKSRKLLPQVAMISFLPPNSDLRVDVPVQIVDQSEQGGLHLEFRGPPLILHLRHTGAAQHHASPEEVASPSITPLHAVSPAAAQARNHPLARAA